MSISALRTSRLAWRKIKRTLEWLFYWTFDTAVLALIRPKPDTKVSVIVHIKLLGDYCLWWPYGRALVAHELARGQRVALVVNGILCPLVTKHFPGCQIIGIGRSRFTRDLGTRAVQLRKLRRLAAGIVYHDTHPRDGLIEDASVRALSGACTWGFDATFDDRIWLDRRLSRRLYSQLIPTMPDVHQAKRHLALLRAVGIKNVETIPSGEFFAGTVLDKRLVPYFVIVPGGSHAGRLWPVERFAQIAIKILHVNPHWRCVVLGTEKEKDLGETISDLVGNNVDNLTGQTELVEFVRWISQARLVVGNDSAACHVAAACGTPNVAVVGGGHYGRCYPYDTSEARVRRLPITVSEPMPCSGCNWICCYPVGVSQPYPCITTIEVEPLWSVIKAFLDEPDASPHAGI